MTCFQITVLGVSSPESDIFIKETKEIMETPKWNLNTSQLDGISVGRKGLQWHIRSRKGLKWRISR